MFEWFKTKNDLMSQIEELKNRLSEAEHEKILSEEANIRAQGAQMKAEKIVSSAEELISYLLKITPHSKETREREHEDELFLRNKSDLVIREIIDDERRGYYYYSIKMRENFAGILELLKREFKKDDIERWEKLHYDLERCKAQKEGILEDKWEIEAEIKKLKEELKAEQERLDLKAKTTINNLQYEAILVNNEGDGPWVTLHIENQPPIKCRLVDIEKINA